MPILDIDIVGWPDDYADNLSQILADSVGLALNSRPQGTWVKLTFVEPRYYAENEGAQDLPPVIARVLQADTPKGNALKQQIADLTSAISSATNRTEASVHLILEPNAKGRVAFGGNLVD